VSSGGDTAHKAQQASGRRQLEKGEGLLLRHAASIHTFFVRLPIRAGDKLTLE